MHANRNASRCAGVPPGKRALIAAIACLLVAALSAPSRADPLTPAGAAPPPVVEAWMAPITVLTMAPTGVWGAAAADTIGSATAAAIADCKRLSGAELGCGAQIVANRAGWTLGIRCGDKNILVAESTLLVAEQTAIDREIELRRVYVPAMPPCIRVVSVDPSGAIFAPHVAELVALLKRK